MESIPLKSPKSRRVRKPKKLGASGAPSDSPTDDTVPIAPTQNSQQNDNLIPEDVEPVYHDISRGWHCCFGPITNMACGWPQGSCTALLTVVSVIMFICGMIGVLIYGIVAGNVNVVLAVLAVFTNGFSFAFGHYSGKSAASAANKVPTTAVTTV